MKKNIVKVLTLATLLSAFYSLTSFAGEWKSDNNGWWYQNDDGSYPKNTWQWIDGNKDGISESYYFNENGYLLTNTTKDGCTVNGDGAWTVNGVVQTQGQKVASNTAQSYDAQYPLKGRVENYLDSYDGNYVWYWTGPNMIRKGVVPAGMTGLSYVYQKAVEDKNATYLVGTSGNGIDVLAKLAGLPATASMGTAEVNNLANEVETFLNSFDWRNASDLEKATRICNRIHKASYDYDAANEADTTGWSNSLSYGAYGCLVNGKAVCQGYTEAANLLAMCVGLQTMEMGDVGHTYPLFLVDGVWLANEPTTQNKYFTVADVYEYNPGYRMMLQLGDTSEFTDEASKYQVIGEYCYKTGYQIPDASQVSKFGSTRTVFGKTAIDFNSSYK
ncbi:hypothetical protein [Clostridium sp. AM28-20LB]|uniref:hypothetical protein n=1 Tax=Clostridium sp. AM28-20LB TaxID=2293027 RepID=UPI000E4A06F6|nr:hypothetical protein [Clostridium sp. AM28-20LB]RHT77625.1 hypothetical protein DW739_01015 [Clostridium sp. AM28-20LB]